MSIVTKDLTYIYSEGMAFEQTALQNVSVSIQDGEFIGLIGHTGSGKSTFVQLLSGLLTPTSGEVFINDKSLFLSGASKKDIFRKVGLVFQYPEHQLFETTVYQDVAFGPKNLGLSEEEIQYRVREALEIVRIPESLYDKSPFDLSGGQKRRIAIAGVLSMNPEILILDEPTAGLDPKGKREVLSQIEHLKGKKTIILVSHIMEDIARLSDRIIVLHKGAVASVGTPKEVFSDGEYLQSIGLSLTQSAELLLKLRKRGFSVDISNFTPEAAAQEIQRVFNGGIK